MVERKKRLKEVYEHLRQHYGIHTQIDFANAIKYSRVYISAAMNGNENNLTDKLFENICEAYPGVFNLDYLLSGKGEMLTNDKVVENPKPFDQGERAALLNRIIDAEKDKNRILERQVSNLEQQVADQRQQIADLRQQLEEYRTRSASISGIVRGKNAFELGVAEPLEPPQPDI